MGIRFSCPNGHKLHVKEFLAGKRAICPSCGAKLVVPPAQASPPPVVREGRQGGSGDVSRPAEDFGSQSIVISIVEPSRTPLARAKPTTLLPIPEPIAPPPVDLVVEAGAVPVTNSSPKLATGPGILEASPSTSPAAKYVTQRTRNRRNQTRLAIALLIAVVVLAIVLIVVLRNQTTGVEAIDAALIETYDTQSADKSWGDGLTRDAGHRCFWIADIGARIES